MDAFNDVMCTTSTTVRTLHVHAAAFVEASPDFSTNQSGQIGDMLLVLACGWFILCNDGLLAYWLEQSSGPIVLAC